MDARGVALLAGVPSRGCGPEELLGSADDGLVSRYSGTSENEGAERGLREASMLFSVAHGYLSKEDPAGALEAASEALSRFRQLNDVVGMADTLRLVVSAHRVMQRDETAMEVARGEMAGFKALGCPRGEAAMLLCMGEVRLTQRRPREALQLLTQALAIFRTLGEKALQASAHLAVAAGYALREWADEALEAAEKAAAIFQELGEKRGEGRSWQAAACAQLAVDDSAGAVEAARKALALFQDVGDKRLEALTLTLLADAHVLSERPGEVLRNASRALQIYQQMDTAAKGEGSAWNRMVVAYVDKGDLTEALRAAHVGLVRMRKRRDRLGEALVQDAMVRVQLARREHERALQAGWEAMELFGQMGQRRHQADRLLVVSMLHLANEQEEWAVQALNEALGLYGQLEDRRGEALVRYAFAHVFAEQRKAEQALQAAQEARAIFQEAGEERWDAEALLLECSVYRATGEFDRLAASAREAQAIFEEVGDTKAAAAALLQISDVHMVSGHHQAALEAAEDASETLREGGHKRAQAQALAVMSSVHLAMEEPERAVTLAQEARELFKRAEDRSGEADALLLLANCSISSAAQEAAAAKKEEEGLGGALPSEMGLPPQHAKALKGARDAVAMARRIDDRDRLASALQSLAQALMLSGQPGEAHAAVDEVVTLSKQAREKGAQSAALTARAEAHLMTDRPELALLAIDRALLLAHEAGDKYGESYAKEVMTHILGDEEPPQEVEEVVEEIVEVEVEDDDDDEVEELESSPGPHGLGLDSDMVRAKINEVARSATGIDEDYSDDSPFMEAGLDSLSAVEFRNRLQEEFQINLSAAVMFDHPTVTSLTQHLMEETNVGLPPPMLKRRAKGTSKQKQRRKRVVRKSGGAAVPSKRLELLAKARLSQGSKVERPCIAGTWDDWAVHEMEWSVAEKCYKSLVHIGSNRWESFQILSEGNWKRCLYPDKHDAGLHSEYSLCGPDDDGHGRNFCIGKDPAEACSEGDAFDVRLWLDNDGAAARVDWLRTGSGDGSSAPASQPYIVGTWSDWKTQHAMSWDEEGRCYYYDMRLGRKGWESFQILMSRQWTRCLHPDKRDGCPHHPHTLCGPDSHGDGKNWTIGKHPLDGGTPGGHYLVRLFLKSDGSPARVDWVSE